jgi:iron complex outermembrane recepter protein
MTTLTNSIRHGIVTMSLPCALAIASLPMLGGMPVSSAAQIEEILVTASRRTETDIQSTAMSISAITANDIDQLSPRDLGDIATLVPNFSAAKPAGFNAASFAMRGVGQTSIIVYQDPQVGVTIDDFVIPHIQTQLLEMFDIEQVEVLRGPQGTLYGKNTTGGVVNVRTRRPVMGENSLEAAVKTESFGRFETRIAGNAAVGETLALRAAGIYMTSDGYWRNNAEFGPVTAFDPAHPALGTTGAVTAASRAVTTPFPAA